MTTQFGEIGPYDATQNWESYEGRFRFYLEANGVDDAKKQRAVLLCTIGPTAYKVVQDLNALTSLTDEIITLNSLLDQLRGF